MAAVNIRRVCPLPCRFCPLPSMSLLFETPLGTFGKALNHAVQDTRKDPRQVLMRPSLLAELTAKGLLNLVPDSIKQLYAILEQDFSPLQLCRKLSPLLDQLEGWNQQLSPASPVQDVSLGHYKKTLQKVCAAPHVPIP